MERQTTPACKLDALSELVNDLVSDQVAAGHMTQADADRWNAEAAAIVTDCPELVGVTWERIGLDADAFVSVA